jgi:signal peptidase I
MMKSNNEPAKGFRLVRENTESKKHFRMIREIIETIILALFILLVIRFAIQNFNIDGTSMEPNLHNAQLVLVDKLTYLFHTPARGDVIVFRAPPDPSEDYVKRVIGLPGDTVTVSGTTVIVNGETLKETYVAPRDQGVPMGTHEIRNLLVPPNKLFVLGDNRAVSSDSRIWGLLPKENIIGRAALVYWPWGADNNGLISNAAPVFAAASQHNPPAGGPWNRFLENINALWLLLLPALIWLILRLRPLKRAYAFMERRRVRPGQEPEPEF